MDFLPGDLVKFKQNLQGHRVLWTNPFQTPLLPTCRVLNTDMLLVLSVINLEIGAHCMLLSASGVGWKGAMYLDHA